MLLLLYGQIDKIEYVSDKSWAERSSEQFVSVIWILG